MAPWTHFEDLEAWKRARELARAVYRVTKTRSFRYDRPLRDQIRRAAVSVMSNIAEGFERGGNREFVQFLSLAKGSAGEVASDLYLALHEEYLPPSEFEKLRELTIHVRRLLGGLMRHLQGSSMRGAKFASSRNSEHGTRNLGCGARNHEA